MNDKNDASGKNVDGQPKQQPTVSEKKIADALVKMQTLGAGGKSIASQRGIRGVMNLETFPGKGRKR